MGKKYYQAPKELIATRYLADTDDKLMNRLIFEGFALVLEGDPMLSSDDSYCGCNCRCCFNELQIVGKTEDQCTKDCGCDCTCCKEHEPKLTKYWINKEGALTFAKEITAEKLKLKGKELDDYINGNFYE